MLVCTVYAGWRGPKLFGNSEFSVRQRTILHYDSVGCLTKWILWNYNIALTCLLFCLAEMHSKPPPLLFLSQQDSITNIYIYVSRHAKRDLMGIAQIIDHGQPVQSAHSDHSQNFSLLADFLCIKWYFYLTKLSLWNCQTVSIGLCLLHSHFDYFILEFQLGPFLHDGSHIYELLPGKIGLKAYKWWIIPSQSPDYGSIRSIFIQQAKLSKLSIQDFGWLYWGLTPL